MDIWSNFLRSRSMLLTFISILLVTINAYIDIDSIFNVIVITISFIIFGTIIAFIKYMLLGMGFYSFTSNPE